MRSRADHQLRAIAGTSRLRRPTIFYYESIMKKYTISSTMSLEAAIRLDLAFSATVSGLLRAHGHPKFSAPVVGQARLSDYPALFPRADMVDCPVVIICLQDSMDESNAHALRGNPLIPENIVSDDLTTRRCYLTVKGTSTDIHIDADAMRFSVNDVDLDRLQVIWIYQGRLFIINQSIDEGWRDDLYMLLMTAGANYRAHHHYTEDELGRAASARSGPHNRNRAKVLRCEVYHRSRDE